MAESSGANNSSADDVSSETGFIASIINEIIYSPLNLLLVTLIAFLIYKIFKSRSDNGVSNVPAEPELPKLRKDFTIQELKKYDGTQPDGRVLVAVNGHVYDVRTQCEVAVAFFCQFCGRFKQFLVLWNLRINSFFLFSFSFSFFSLHFISIGDKRSTILRAR